MESSIRPHRDGSIEWQVPQVMHVLRAAEKEPSIDYTVLSVVVTTLALILVVELVRHKLDISARERPFFKTVLEGVYRELATLGIVEFFIFLLHKYYANLNIQQELVFADVHFMLFYTAIFNAFQSVIMAVCVSRVSDRLWVRTEELELDHYVEIREEFELVEELLRKKEGKTSDEKAEEKSDSSVPLTGTDWLAEFAIPYNIAGMKRAIQGFFRFLRYPHLYRRHRDLLIQIRFHELRVHFLTANNLPLKMKVSEYLIRSELFVLTKLVHISTFAWLLLTGGTNLLYFLMGIVVDVSDKPKAVGQAMGAIYLSTMIFFVVLSLVIFNKIKWIFSKIMHMKLISHGASTFKSGRRSQEQVITNQLDLFWGSDPKYITVMIQFMQFGFAIALSILLVFWDDIDVEGSAVSGLVFLLTVICCYVAFVATMAQVIPRYTLCTSLGQLVNNRRLHETLARFRLEEARRRQLQMKEEQGFDDAFGTEDSDDEEQRDFSVPDGRFRAERSPFGPGIAGTKLVERVKKLENMDLNTAKSMLLAELVQMDTKELRTTLPQRKLQDKEQRIRDRGNRRKAVSDGVASMRHLVGLSEAASFALDDKVVEIKNKVDEPGELPPAAINPREPSKGRRQRFKSISACASIQQMRDGMLFGDTTKPTDLNNHDSTTELPRSRASRRASGSEAHRLQPLMENSPPDTKRKSPVLRTKSMQEKDADVLSNGDGNSVSSDKFGTLDSTLSDDGLSDADDIPDVDPSVKQRYKAEPEPSPTIFEIACSYFAGERYPMISAVFGTMICFFAVGQRVEALLLATCVLSDTHNTWDFKLRNSFMLETVWLCCFILVSSLVMYMFRPRQMRNNKERTLFLGAILDVALSGVCLCLLMVSEMQRCCHDDGERALASEPSVELETCHSGCSCGPFGSRTYGGVGVIEPITSIIALRVFRFHISNKILQFLDRKMGWSNDDISHADVAGTNVIIPLHPLFDEKSHHDNHKTKSLEYETGTISDIWKMALGLYPEIVEKYGEFSSELLQAMLGIDVVYNPGVASEPPHATKQIGDLESPSPHRKSPADSGLNLPQLSPRQEVSSDFSHLSGFSGSQGHRRRKSFAVDKRYSGLSPDAQSIILSGKIGKGVRSTRALSEDSVVTPTRPVQHGASQRLFSLTERNAAHNVSSQDVFHTAFPSGWNNHRRDKSNAPPEFEIDKDESVSKLDDALGSFISPNARLLRSMRRCDRKLMPLLPNWTAVDVVMTKYEIVYFDVEHLNNDNIGTEEFSKIAAVRQAVIATKGGKGLRLRDVAIGRRVVAHLALSSVDSIHIERILPHSGDEGRNRDGNQPDDAREAQDEFWKPRNGTDRHSRALRWEHVKEDRLKIHSIQGTLYLRFYSDLEDSGSHRDRCLNEREDEGPIFKNNAFQWCQTIVRLCGIDQLKQKLPHYGDDSSEELRDYLEVIDRKDDKSELRASMMGKLRHSISTTRLDMLVTRTHRRGWSAQVDLPTDLLAELPIPLTRKPSFARRAVSFGDSDSAVVNLQKPTRMRRTASTGDAEDIERVIAAVKNCPDNV